MQDMLELAAVLAHFALHRHWGPVLGMTNMVNTGLQKILPDDAHVLCSNRLHVSLTSITVPPTNIIVSNFTSKQDLIDVLAPGSKVNAQTSPGVCTDGMNTAGLAVSALMQVAALCCPRS